MRRVSLVLVLSAFPFSAAKAANPFSAKIARECAQILSGHSEAIYESPVDFSEEMRRRGRRLRFGLLHRASGYEAPLNVTPAQGREARDYLLQGRYRGVDDEWNNRDVSRDQQWARARQLFPAVSVLLRAEGVPHEIRWISMGPITHPLLRLLPKGDHPLSQWAQKLFNESQTPIAFAPTYSQARGSTTTFAPYLEVLPPTLWPHIVPWFIRPIKDILTVKISEPGQIIVPARVFTDLDYRNGWTAHVLGHRATFLALRAGTPTPYSGFIGGHLLAKEHPHFHEDWVAQILKAAPGARSVLTALQRSGLRSLLADDEIPQHTLELFVNYLQLAQLLRAGTPLSDPAFKFAFLRCQELSRRGAALLALHYQQRSESIEALSDSSSAPPQFVRSKSGLLWANFVYQKGNYRREFWEPLTGVADTASDEEKRSALKTILSNQLEGDRTYFNDIFLKSLTVLEKLRSAGTFDRNDPDDRRRLWDLYSYLQTFVQE